MTPQVPVVRVLSKKLSLCNVAAAAVLLCGGTYLPLLPTPASAQDAAAASPSFEVASIKPNRSGNGNSGWSWQNANFTADNVTVMQLLGGAFHVHDYQVVNAPKWANDTKYDVAAKADGAVQDVAAKEQQRLFELRLQALLAERCKLRFHRETKTFPIYEMVAAKGGPKLQESTDKNYGTNTSDKQMKATGITMEQMAESLSGRFSRPVLDKTGLAGRYDFTLNYAPDRDQDRGQAASGYGENAAQPDAGPSIFTALQDQLGLKLVAAKGPIEVIVIDSIEPPSAN